jgi:hypothetical protein
MPSPRGLSLKALRELAGESEKKKTMIRQRAISAVGTSYVHEVVLDLLGRAFTAYEKRDHTKSWIGLSGLENVSATVGILLTAVTIEASRNRIFYLAKKRISRSAADDLGKFLFDRTRQMSAMADILKEIFTIRDVIVHNHLYSITFYQTEDWEFIGHRQRLLKGYGDPKFKQLVSSRTRRTKCLDLNAQPLKIGFEDLWLVLVVFDVLLKITENKTGQALVIRHSYRFEGKWQQERGLSRLLSWHYDRIQATNARASKRLKKVLARICQAFNDPEVYEDSFLSNRCPYCKEFGFRKPNQIYKCGKCGRGFEELETVVEGQQT